ncbi:MAG: hypothetical protein JWQ59_655 [Cryobacterium sp.]|jgi:hypothetical protein|nr:hypothetical protein [Cryobacterium sp.]
MKDAELDLPAKRTVLRSFAGHLDAPPDAVYPLLARELAPGDETGGHFLADPGRRLVVVQGDWWYRGEYRVLPEDGGSRIEHEIYNVAQVAHWAGALTGRSVVRRAAAAFQRVLSDIAAGLRRPGS